MKRYIVFIFLISCLFYNGLAQSKSQKSNSPKEDIKVNREYDDQGNLIRFDSTYTYNWSGDTTLTFGNMPENFGSFFDDHFNFFNDSSLLGHSSFNDLDQMFGDLFRSKHDSVFMKNFGFDSFNFKNDSSLGNFREFDELLGRQNWKNQDSISSKSNKNPNNTDHNSMDDMFRMMQEKMHKMEEFHRQFYRKSSD